MMRKRRTDAAKLMRSLVLLLYVVSFLSASPLGSSSSSFFESPHMTFKNETITVIRANTAAKVNIITTVLDCDTNSLSTGAL